MSLAFSDTDNYRGLVQEYEKEVGFDYGEVSDSVTRLKSLTSAINLALDDFTALAIRSSGTWQFDDSNQDDYPVVSADLIAGQRDYVLTSDEGGNLVLDIAKVMVADSHGVFRKIDPVDVESQEDTSGFYDNQSVRGIPTRYDKLANGIFLDPPSSYNMRLANEGVAGLKLYINRESAYFAYTDTTRKPGIPGLFHRYLVIVPAYRYASRNSMPIAGGRLRNGAFTGLLMEIKDMERDIGEYFGMRSRDERKRVTPAQQNNK